MESHPSYLTLESTFRQTPEHAGVTFLVYNDLVLSQKWLSVSPYMLESANSSTSSSSEDAPPNSSKSSLIPIKRPFLLAVRHQGDRPRVIVPLALNESLSVKWFKSVFATILQHPAYLAAGLPHSPPQPPRSCVSSPSARPVPPVGVEGEQDPPVIYTAIVSKDSTVVYYRIARGVEKPHDVPE